MNQGPRPLTFDDLEFKVDGNDSKRNNQTWAPIVAYIKGHKVSEILDDWVGPLNWRDHYETWELDGAEMIRCYISIRFEGEWVTKEDVGSYSASFGGDSGNSRKGGISDAFKRCASRKWGVGRRVFDLSRRSAPVGLNKNSKPVVTNDTLDYLVKQYKVGYPWLFTPQPDEKAHTTPHSPPKPSRTKKRATTPKPDPDAQKASAPETREEVRESILDYYLGISGATASKLDEALGDMSPISHCPPERLEEAAAVIMKILGKKTLP
jgi:hypothetical protein